MKSHSTFSSNSNEPCQNNALPPCHRQSQIFTPGPNQNRGQGWALKIKTLIDARLRKGWHRIKMLSDTGKRVSQMLLIQNGECACVVACFLHSQWGGGGPLEGKKYWLMMLRKRTNVGEQHCRIHRKTSVSYSAKCVHLCLMLGYRSIMSMH